MKVKHKPLTSCSIWHHNLARKIEKTGDESLAFQPCPHCGSCPPPGPSYEKPPKITFTRSATPMKPHERQAAYLARKKANDEDLIEREIRWLIDCSDLMVNPS